MNQTSYTNITLTHDKSSGIASLVFDRPNASANLFDQQTLEECISATVSLKNNPDVKGLIISSAKPKIYIAGADLKTLSQLKGDAIAQIIDLGQQMADTIASLPFTTVAAINGACVGGGYELALACDWRVASDSSAVKVGLPETKLGILPGWGGSTRLPRLISLPKALPLILSGKLLNAKAAKRKGLIDEYCPQENLPHLASRYVTKGKRSLPSFKKFHNPLSVAVIKSQATKDLLKKTHGHYPAPLAALNVACRGITTSIEKSLSYEKEEFLKLTETTISANLIKLFFLSEKAKKAKIDLAEGHEAPAIHTVSVIGSGVMGAGIAYWLTSRGFPTLLKDLNGEALAKGVSSIHKLYQQAVSRHVMSKTQARKKADLLTSTTQNTPLHQDLIIEAAVEDLEIKKKIFLQLAAQSRPDTILATNTSALPISEIALATPQPERVVGIHFFNPVHRMPLVEIVKTDSTSPETLAATLTFVQKIGKTPIIVKDSPGFLVNRVLVPYLIEAAKLFLSGEDPQQIDQAMLEFGMPMGPIRLLDEVGLDVGMHVANTLASAFPDRMSVPDLLPEMIERGWLGKKSGKGFYLYENGKQKTVNPEVLTYQASSSQKTDRATIGQKLSHMMTAETQLCVDEGVVASPEEANLAMILGTGFAPFRGGPLS